jgi:hypothetical protein
MLNPHQLTFVANRIKKATNNKQVAEEMLDHYATRMEHDMLLGIPFEEAFEKSFDDMPISTVTHISKKQKQIKLEIMFKKVSPPAFLLSMSAFIVFTNISSQEKPWNMPIAENDITSMPSGFGFREHPIYKTKKLHKGIDFIAPTGTPVNAVQRGIVTKVSQTKRGYGNMIEITHDDSTISRYAHLHEIKVVLDQKIEDHEIIGSVGSTGTSTAPHLHFEMMKEGVTFNPAPFIFPSDSKTTKE